MCVSEKCENNCQYILSVYIVSVIDILIGSIIDSIIVGVINNIIVRADCKKWRLTARLSVFNA
jgi:hypothetical protein